jgi:hypothetical protein
LSVKNFSRLFGLSRALVSWKRNSLLPEPPPLATKRNALGRDEVDLGREVGAGVRLLEHVERRHLRVAQVLLGVALVDAARQLLGVVAARPDLLALLADDGAGARVLAHGQDAARRDLGVLEQRERDIAVVGRRLRVLEDGGDLLEMLRAQEEIRVVVGLPRDIGQRLRRDLQDLPALEGGGRDALLAEQAILGVIGAEGEGILVNEGRRRHAGTVAQTFRMTSSRAGRPRL